MRRLALALAAAAGLWCSPASAAPARQGPSSAGGLLSLHLIPASYWGHWGFGFGGRYELQLVPEGFLPRRARLPRDDLSLDFGADFVHANYGRYVVDWDPVAGRYVYDVLTYNAVVPTVGVLWNLRITPRLTVYPKIDTGFFVGWWSFDAYYGNPGHGRVFVQGAAGLTYDVGALRLKAELGSGMLKLGVQLPL